MTNLPGLLTEAMRHHVSGQLPEAERIYRQILQVDPRHSDALHLLGVIAHQVGQNHVAVERICKAIGINQTTSDYHSNLGNALRALGRPDDAVAAYSNALLIKPDFAEAYTNLGNALRDVGRLNDAVAACNVALRIKPDSADAYFNLGNALKDLGRIDDSITAYDSALCIRPDYAPSAELTTSRDHMASVSRRKMQTSTVIPSWVYRRDRGKSMMIGSVSGSLIRFPQ